jgi:hypothetical protein
MYLYLSKAKPVQYVFITQKHNSVFHLHPNGQHIFLIITFSFVFPLLILFMKKEYLATVHLHLLYSSVSSFSWRQVYFFLHYITLGEFCGSGLAKFC